MNTFKLEIRYQNLKKKKIFFFNKSKAKFLKQI